jgi:hypothetical protein
MSPVLLVWLTVNAATLVMSAFAIQSANHDAKAVKALNGAAREAAVEGARQQEYIRFLKAALLLAVSLVPLFDGRKDTIQLTWGIALLTLVPVLIWAGAFVSWRTRRRLDALVRKP